MLHKGEAYTMHLRTMQPNNVHLSYTPQKQMKTKRQGCGNERRKGEMKERFICLVEAGMRNETFTEEDLLILVLIFISLTIASYRSLAVVGKHSFINFARTICRQFIVSEPLSLSASRFQLGSSTNLAAKAK